MNLIAICSWFGKSEPINPPTTGGGVKSTALPNGVIVFHDVSSLADNKVYVKYVVECYITLSN